MAQFERQDQVRQLRLLVAPELIRSRLLELPKAEELERACFEVVEPLGLTGRSITAGRLLAGEQAGLGRAKVGVGRPWAHHWGQPVARAKPFTVPLAADEELPQALAKRLRAVERELAGPQ